MNARSFDGFARGLSIPQLAAELFIGTSTVKTYAQRLYEKLGVSDRAAAVAEAMRRGLLDVRARDEAVPSAVESLGAPSDWPTGTTDLYGILLDHAYRGMRVQIVLRWILVAFVVAVVSWIAPARDRVGCYTIAAIYAVWALG